MMADITYSYLREMSCDGSLRGNHITEGDGYD